MFACRTVFFAFEIPEEFNRVLKKSFPGFFSYDLAEINSSKSHKLLDCLSRNLAIHPWIA